MEIFKTILCNCFQSDCATECDKYMLKCRLKSLDQPWAMSCGMKVCKHKVLLGFIEHLSHYSELIRFANLCAYMNRLRAFESVIKRNDFWFIIRFKL